VDLKSKILSATLIMVAAAALISLSYPFETKTTSVTYTSNSVSYGNILKYSVPTSLSFEVACVTLTQNLYFYVENCTSAPFGQYNAKSWVNYFCATDTILLPGQNGPCVIVGSTIYTGYSAVYSWYNISTTNTISLSWVSTSTNEPLYIQLGLSTQELFILIGAVALAAIILYPKKHNHDR